MSADLVEQGRRVLRMERDALEAVACRLDASFGAAVRLLAACSGRVIVTGVGKSGLVGRKIAATLTSTGTPATFLHPVEGIHGDLGIVGPSDIALLISKSGETAELFPLLEQLRRLGVQIIAIAGERESTLAHAADIVLDTAVREEACPLDLAPTTSTTAALAMGDAIAITLLAQKGFRREDFARLHPGGALGKKLLTRVSDVMVTDPLPLLPPQAMMREAIILLARLRGTVAIVDDDRHVLGVVTAGDFTRLMEKESDVFAVPVDRVMNRTPKTAHTDELGSAVVFRMEKFGIMAMPVLDATDRVVGMIHLHDLMRAGVA